MPARTQVVSALMAATTTTTTSAANAATHSSGNDSGSHSATPSANSPTAPPSSGPRRSARHVAFCLSEDNNNDNNNNNNNNNNGGGDGRAANAAPHTPPSDSAQSTSALPSSSWCSRAETEALRELALERGVDFARVASELGFEVVTTVATMSQHGQRRSGAGAPHAGAAEGGSTTHTTPPTQPQMTIEHADEAGGVRGGGREGRAAAGADPLSEAGGTIENCTVHIHGTKQQSPEQPTLAGAAGRQDDGQAEVQRRLSAHSRPRTTNQPATSAAAAAVGPCAAPVPGPPLRLSPPAYLYPVVGGTGAAQDDWLPRDWHRGRSSSSATSSLHVSPTEECGAVPILTPPLLFSHHYEHHDGSQPSAHDASHEDSPHADAHYYTRCPDALHMHTLATPHEAQPPQPQQQQQGLPPAALGSTVSLATNATLNVNNAVPLSPDRPQDASVSESLSIPVPSTGGTATAAATTHMNQPLLLLPTPLVTAAGGANRTRRQVNAPPTHTQLMTPHERMPLPLSSHTTPRLVELGSTDTSPDNLSPRRWAAPPSPPTRRPAPERLGRQHVSRLSSRGAGGGGRVTGTLSSSNNSSTHTLPLAPNTAHMNAFSSGRSNASTSVGSTAWAEHTDSLEMQPAPWTAMNAAGAATAPASLQLRRRGDMLNAREERYGDGPQPADIH